VRTTPGRREKKGRILPLGLCDLDRNIRPVGRAYKDLIASWREVLPTSSICLQVPVTFPSEFDEPFVHRQMERARRRRATTLRS